MPSRMSQLGCTAILALASRVAHDRSMTRASGKQPRLALMMGGGGALAAYQVGALAALAEATPDLRVSILSGVSAGAINVVALGSRRGNFAARTEGLEEAWLELTPEKVFQVAPRRVAWRALRWLVRLGSGGLLTRAIARRSAGQHVLAGRLR